MPTYQAPVACLSQGKSVATGFTTRSDLDPARDGLSEDQIKEVLAKRAAQLGLAPDKKGKEKEEEE